MISYIIRRLLLLLPTVFLALSFLFFLFFLLPGRPGRRSSPAAANRDGRPGRRRARRRALRPRRPDPRRSSCNYWARTLRWDLGDSFQNNRSVNDILGEKAPRASASPSGPSLIEIVVGISVGLISAVRRYSIADKLTTIVTAAASARPGVRAGLHPAVRVRGVPEQARLAGVVPAADLRASGPTAGALLHPDG